MSTEATEVAVDETPEDDVEMTFFEHLVELRTRLIRALAGLLPGLGIAWYFKDQLTGWFMLPYTRAKQNDAITGEMLVHWFVDPIDPGDGEPTEIIVLGLTDIFMTQLVMAAIVGLILTSPWVFYQLWAFISPGLYRREKRLAVPFVAAATFFFTLGAYFAFTLVLPLAFRTLLDMGGQIAANAVIVDQISLDRYLTLTSKLMLGFGLTFLVPVVIATLSLLGMVNWKQLAKFGRWWLLISVVVAAILTPPDPFTQLLMAVPLNILYWVAVLFAMAFGKKPVKPGELTEDGYER